jgi:hypothetical protein
VRLSLRATGRALARQKQKDGSGMIRNTVAVVVLLAGLLVSDALGQQLAGNLLFCKRSRAEAGTYLADADGQNLKKIMFAATKRLPAARNWSVRTIPNPTCVSRSMPCDSSAVLSR